MPLAAPAAAASPHVAGLQVALRAYGFYGGPVDGVRGPGDRVRDPRLPGKEGLTADGVAGQLTRKALGKLGAPLFGRRSLARGRVGLDVAGLQFLLARNGLRDDGGRLLRREDRGGGRQFQSRTGLAADGVAGPATLAALRGAVARVAQSAASRELRRPLRRLAHGDRRRGTGRPSRRSRA